MTFVRCRDGEGILAQVTESRTIVEGGRGRVAMEESRRPHRDFPVALHVAPLPRINIRETIAVRGDKICKLESQKLLSESDGRTLRFLWITYGVLLRSYHSVESKGWDGGRIGQFDRQSWKQTCHHYREG